MALDKLMRRFVA